jgi:hypothetical protein
LGSLLALPLVACSASSNGAAQDSDYDDVAQNVGTTTASRSGGDIQAMADVVLVASGNIPLGFTLGADGHVDGNFLGIDYSFTIVCRNGQGTILADCNSTTQLVDAKLDWSGSLALPNFSTTMTRHGDWSLMNMQESTVKLAGNGTFSFDSSITNPSTSVTAAYHFDYDAAYMSVFIDKASRLATSGEIQYDISASKTVSGQSPSSFSIHADVTFNGDATATITLDGSHRYSLDLTTGIVVAIH